MQICLEQNYPKNLVLALQLIHKIDPSSQDIQIYWDKALTEADSTTTVVFLFDKGKRNIDLTTEWYYEKGFRVFAFKLSSVDKLDPFQLSLTILRIWRKVLGIIKGTESPFVVTYTYQGKSLFKARG